MLTISDIEIPERQRLRVYDKVPMYPSNLKPPKMQKRLRYMRGPEPLHTTLQLQQYGVVVSMNYLCKHAFFDAQVSLTSTLKVFVYNYNISHIKYMK